MKFVRGVLVALLLLAAVVLLVVWILTGFPLWPGVALLADGLLLVVLGRKSPAQVAVENACPEWFDDDDAS